MNFTEEQKILIHQIKTPLENIKRVKKNPTLCANTNQNLNLLAKKIHEKFEKQTL